MSSISDAAGMAAGRVQAYGNITADATISGNSNQATAASIRMNQEANNLNVLNGAAAALEGPKKGAKELLTAASRSNG